ncbi:MAG: DUF3293 domain-containing protein [Pseudomonadota bacterium]|nr:DUF3293 domain-containing protein [Pseudomonadota bacterium]
MQQTTSRSRIEASLIEAYRATHYCVTGLYPSFLLRADTYSSDLALCHRTHSVACSAFITAWNPLSVATSHDENVAAQVRLEARLRACGCVLIAGLGVDPTGQWEGEESLLALGLELDTATLIAREFQQNGLLWAGADAVPKLILLR